MLTIRYNKDRYSVTVTTTTADGSQADQLGRFRSFSEAVRQVIDWQEMDEAERYAERLGWLISYTINDHESGERFTLTRQPSQAAKISYTA